MLIAGCWMLKHFARSASGGRLCELSRSKSGGRFYHLQYRRKTKLFQKYIPLDEVEAYKETTERFREFTEAVDAYIDEMSAKSAKNITKEAKRAKRKTGRRPTAEVFQHSTASKTASSSARTGMPYC